MQSLERRALRTLNSTRIPHGLVREAPSTNEGIETTTCNTELKKQVFPMFGRERLKRCRLVGLLSSGILSSIRDYFL